MKKLYCKVNFERKDKTGDVTTLVRVDNIKSFVSVFPSEELFKSHFENQLKLKAKNPSRITDPYIIYLREENFLKLAAIIKSKLGIIGEISTQKMDIVFNSHSHPVYRINRN
jgi:hypothetical protein